MLSSFDLLKIVISSEGKVGIEVRQDKGVIYSGWNPHRVKFSKQLVARVGQ